MTLFSKKTLNRIRVMVVKVITVIMTLILVICMDTYDADMRVWLPLTLVSLTWTILVMVANGVFDRWE